LHENCPHRRRLHAVGETIDGFSFQARPTAHVSEIGDLRKNERGSFDALFLRHNMRQHDAGQ
jgi:hypothetical protein